MRDQPLPSPTPSMETTPEFAKRPLSPEMQASLRSYERDAARMVQPSSTPPAPTAGEFPIPPTADSAVPTRAPEVERRRGYATDERRKRLESQLEPMDLTDLVVNGRVRQNVTLIPKLLTVTFQSLRGNEVQWIEQAARAPLSLAQDNVQMYRALLESNTERQLLRLLLSIHAINGAQLPVASQGMDETVRLRKERILELSANVIELLNINLDWFDERVAKLFDDDFAAVKNG